MTIEYDGSGFSGWQRQEGKRTVQAVLEEGLSKFCGTEVKIDGTSRTDRGVHALGQRASFFGDFAIPTDKLMFAVNNYLAGGMNVLNSVGDVRISNICEMPMDFHARYNAKGKHYRYIIKNSGEPDIFRRKYTYYVKDVLNVEDMRIGANAIIGTHDFKSFQASGGHERKTTVRTIFDLDISCHGEYLIIDVKGDGFLYNMVRIIVGTLVDVGRGRILPQDIENIIESRDRQRAGHTAPAEGLYLMEVYYEETQLG